MIAKILLVALLAMGVPVLVLLVVGWKPRKRAAIESGPAGGVELPRANILEPRRWRMPDGSIVGQAVNWEAVELLENDPDEYFRRRGMQP